jgi:hypothetical protein
MNKILQMLFVITALTVPFDGYGSDFDSNDSDAIYENSTWSYTGLPPSIAPSSGKGNTFQKRIIVNSDLTLNSGATNTFSSDMVINKTLDISESTNTFPDGNHRIIISPNGTLMFSQENDPMSILAPIDLMGGLDITLPATLDDDAYELIIDRLNVNCRDALLKIAKNDKKLTLIINTLDLRGNNNILPSLWFDALSADDVITINSLIYDTSLYFALGTEETATYNPSQQWYGLEQTALPLSSSSNMIRLRVKVGSDARGFVDAVKNNQEYVVQDSNLKFSIVNFIAPTPTTTIPSVFVGIGIKTGETMTVTNPVHLVNDLKIKRLGELTDSGDATLCLTSGLMAPQSGTKFIILDDNLDDNGESAPSSHVRLDLGDMASADFSLNDYPHIGIGILSPYSLPGEKKMRFVVPIIF